MTITHMLTHDDSSTEAEITLPVRTESLPSDGQFIDRFSDTRPPGRVIGTSAEHGVTRKGVDKENVIGIDGGALRFQPLIKPRWGRSGIAYGPYARRNGLGFGVSILNGHNTSQTGALPDAFPQRLKQWILGSRTEKPLTRIRRWARSGQRKFTVRHLLRWAIAGSRYLQTATVDENLAVGWFPSESPKSPTLEGSAFLMHALGPDCGELWVRSGLGVQRTVYGVQNVQLYLFVILRERGAAYYAASISGVPGLGSYPAMTLLGIDPFNADLSVFAGIHQSVLGQIGFRVDTRVYRTQVAGLQDYNEWFGSASGADSLQGDGPLEASRPPVGGNWTVWKGGLQRTLQGLQPDDADNAAVLQLTEPAGLIHMLVETGGEPVDSISLLWRVRDHESYWAFEVGSRKCSLAVKENGVLSKTPATRFHYLAPNAVNSVQVFDDGQTIRLYLNGDLVYGTHLTDLRLHNATGVGIQSGAGGATARLRDFEAHPRRLPVPPEFDLGEPWHRVGNTIVVEDNFRGGPGDLAGRTTVSGARIWRREIGDGAICLTGEGAAKVRGTVREPCPGRTAYTIGWDNPRFADVSVEITPPGTRKGNQERGRGGIIFWQDERNYITLTAFVDDWYGTSIAAFFYRDGFEELYDAVWTNLGRRLYWGVPYDFRVAFDSQNFMAYVDGEPVLYRALRDVYPDWKELPIHRTGLVVNWEWGTDTGSVFRNFIARDLP